jgi:hypothetical protein
MFAQGSSEAYTEFVEKSIDDRGFDNFELVAYRRSFLNAVLSLVMNYTWRS